MTPTPDRPGFLGLGLMGLPMARRLIGAGCRLTVWNRSRAKAEASGGVIAASPRALAEASDILFTCVTDAAAMEAVVFGPGGVAEAEGSGKLLVDHSSIHPEATRNLAARLAAANGMAWLDAPVSGGVAGAEAGTLTVMAGGSEAEFARAAPFLAHLSARATLMGPLGAGQTAKLCNQMIVACSFTVIAEALRLAAKSGIDPARLIPALAGGFADSKPLQIFGPRMLAPVTEPVARLGIVLKDVETALDVGRQAAAAMPMTEAAAAIYRRLAEAGHGEAEFDVIYRDDP